MLSRKKPYLLTAFITFTSLTRKVRSSNNKGNFLMLWFTISMWFSFAVTKRCFLTPVSIGSVNFSFDSDSENLEMRSILIMNNGGARTVPCGMPCKTHSC